MIKFRKSNKIISLLLLIVCIIFMIKPNIYAKSCLDAISVWSLKILPVLFPFFIFTRLIVNLNDYKPNCMDKLWNKIYHTPPGSFSTYFLATLSGYPMGAKLICTMHDNGKISSKDGYKMLSFCSVSGPMFILGTVGIGMLKSYKHGLIILFANIIASLINGLLYRGKHYEITDNIKAKSENKNNSLADCVYDALISILMVGGYIVLSFLIIEILKNLNIIYYISLTICRVFNCNQHLDVVQSFICGLIEITKGILDLSTTNLSLKYQTILSSTLIGFGGVSIFLQSKSFLNKLNISTKSMIKQKTTQSLLCLIITSLLCFIFI